MPGRHFLFIPGPTNIPDRVLRAMAVPSEDHRSSAFPELLVPVLANLKKIFRTTQGQAFVFPTTGTGGWEIALTNALSPGDKVLAARFGQFSHLWIDLARRRGLDVDVIEEAWGAGADPEKILAKLEADKTHQYKAVLIVHNETATGVTSDVAAVRKAIDAAKHPALLFVDGVSSIGSLNFQFDEWGVDFAVAGSQKGFMLPAGLGLVCVSQKGLEARKTAKSLRAFFDLEDHIKANATGYTPYTPSIPLLHGLRESMAIMLEEGLDNVAARHNYLASGVRAAVGPRVGADRDA